MDGDNWLRRGKYCVNLRGDGGGGRWDAGDAQSSTGGCIQALPYWKDESPFTISPNTFFPYKKSSTFLFPFHLIIPMSTPCWKSSISVSFCHPLALRGNSMVDVEMINISKLPLTIIYYNLSGQTLTSYALSLSAFIFLIFTYNDFSLSCLCLCLFALYY